MKKFIYVFLGATLSLGMLSCSSGKKKEMTIAEQYLRPASMNYSGKDSSEIKTLVENYVSALKSKNIEAAANMLYFVRNDSIFPITENDRKGLTALYSSMPILDCKATTLILRSEDSSEIDGACRHRQTDRYHNNLIKPSADRRQVVSYSS